MNKLPENILALASIVQTIALINELANHGQCDSQSCDASIKSLTKSSTKFSEIYPAKEDLTVGLSMLKSILEKSNKNKNILLYSLSLIKLEKVLMRESKMLKNITTGIDEIKTSKYFDINHQKSIEKLAKIYKDNAGKLQPKIIITGEKNNLSNADVVNHIRALLLAGIRNVSLWRANGGNLWNLIFNKRKIIKQIKSLNA